MLVAFAIMVLLFVVAKLLFMASCGSGHGVGWGDVWQVLRHGLSLDLSTALYVIAPLLLGCLVAVWVRIPRWLIKAYFILVSVALALAFVADTSLYEFWGFKLDASCLSYLQQPEGITQSVSVGYLVLRFLLWVIAAAVIYGLCLLSLRCLKDETRSRSTLNIEHSTLNDDRNTAQPPFNVQRSTLSRVGESLLYLALIPLMVVGMRGGLSESTTNIGQVYFSQNQFLNHAAVNPVFSFLSSLGHQMGDEVEYAFMDDAECQRLTAGVFTTESLDADTLLRTPRPTIVVILLESAGEQFASAMPQLQRLKQEGINFSRCYANSWRTDRGTLCTLSGYPSFPTVSVMKMPSKSRSLPSIARTLQAEGYPTSYLYGGDINFTNMRSYLIATGWQQLVSMDDFTLAEQHSAQWGVRDDITFDYLYRQITSLPAGQPALMGYSTLSSHEPWDVPDAAEGMSWQRHDDEVFTAFAYLDACLAHFIDRLRTMPVWEQLLIVVTADHGVNHADIDQSRPLQKNHIPMLWLGGAVREPRTIDVLCNQSDLAATLLGQMGLTHTDFAFSRDVLSSSYTHPTAVHNYNNAQWMVDSTGHVLYDLDARRIVIDESSDAEQLAKQSQAILQLTSEDLRGR